MSKKRYRPILFLLGMLLLPVVLAPITGSLTAEEAAKADPVVTAQARADEAVFTVNNVWMMLSAALVFIMHLGFSAIESGLTRSKNTVNILFKNVMIVGIGLVTYAIMGFNLMYPGESWIAGKWLGFAGFGLANDPSDPANITSAYNAGYTYFTDFLFQGMFAATAATIVSGAVAERIKLHSFLIFSVFYVMLVYPLIGSWKWGAGFLNDLGFIDFAGSTLVHSVGGWGALAGILLLGPRIGKYSPAGSINPVMGHNMPLATIGMFLLWLGWFGFNGGSVLSADPGLVSFVLVTTCLAAAAGLIGAVLTSWIIQGKPDLSMALNGVLAGLVGITAGADTISVMNSIIVGGIAGVLVFFSVVLLDKIKIDDPVGAVSVHLVCGIWGTLAVGIFSFNADHTFMKQLTGVAAAALAFPAALLLMFLVKLIFGLRVSEEEELKGLDIGEHGQEAYDGFETFVVK